MATVLVVDDNCHATRHEPDLSREADVAVGTVHLWERAELLRPHVHVGEETRGRSIDNHELIPLRARRGTRTDALTKPHGGQKNRGRSRPGEAGRAAAMPRLPPA